ncbi:MAG: 6-carboxytetrahydropterin synthase [Phycisphaeraceae bacterium]|nr:6-carboxytetrahydropterin synthase [Phycisphaeraceae bacterium]
MHHRLTRVIRLNAGFEPLRPGPSPGGYAGRPTLRGLGFQQSIEIACVGPLDPHAGYLIDIQTIDAAVREQVAPIFFNAQTADPSIPAWSLLPSLLAAAREAIPVPVASLMLHLTPYHCVEMGDHTGDSALVRMRFDFAASHRLHCDSLSDEENRRRFGKCNYPNGHGHNYQFEPCIELSPDADGVSADAFRALEQVAREQILDRYDHRHLNLDAPEFGPLGVNPTVENIARVFYERIGPVIAQRCPGARLRSVTVWETDRTSSTFPA